MYGGKHINRYKSTFTEPRETSAWDNSSPSVYFPHGSSTGLTKNHCGWTHLPYLMMSCECTYKRSTTKHAGNRGSIHHTSVMYG